MKQKPTICSLNIKFEGLDLYVCRIHIADCGGLDERRGKETPTTRPVADLEDGKMACSIHCPPALRKRVRLFQDEIASSLNQILLRQAVSSSTLCKSIAFVFLPTRVTDIPILSMHNKLSSSAQ